MPPKRCGIETLVAFAWSVSARARLMLVTNMRRARALTLQPSAKETSVSIPHLFGGIRAYGEATRTLSCAR